MIETTNVDIQKHHGNIERVHQTMRVCEMPFPGWLQVRNDPKAPEPTPLPLVVPGPQEPALHLHVTKAF